jgi:hypothetical protein
LATLITNAKVTRLFTQVACRPSCSLRLRRAQGQGTIGSQERARSALAGTDALEPPISVTVATFEEYALGGNARFEHIVTIVTDIHQCAADSSQLHLVLRSDGGSRDDCQIAQLSCRRFKSEVQQCSIDGMAE